MPRQPKLRKKNGYWMTKAGGTEKYFGKIDQVPYKTAQQEFLQHLRSLDGQPTKRAVLTCLEVCDRHLDWVHRNRSQPTYKQRQHFLQRWCEFEVVRGGHRVSIGTLAYPQVSLAELQQWLDALRDHGLDRSTQRAGQTAVKACWNWATHDPPGLFPADYRPFGGMPKIHIPKKPLTEADLITAEEIDLLLQHANDDLGKIRGDKGRYRERQAHEFRAEADNPYGGFSDVLHTYYHTGARTSELAHIQVRDVLHRTQQVVLGKHKRSQTMAEPVVRQLTLNDEVYAILQRASQGKSPDDLVFTQHNDSPWNKDRLDERFRKIRARAGVRPDVTIYSFRDLWISEALMAGNEIATVAKMAGTSIKMIEQVYGHFRSEHFEQAQRKLDQERRRRKRPTDAESDD